MRLNNNYYCKSVLNFSEGISYVQKCTLMRLTLPHTNTSHSVKHLVIWKLQIILCQYEVLAWLSCGRFSSNVNYPRSKLCAFLDIRERNESWLEIHADIQPNFFQLQWFQQSFKIQQTMHLCLTYPRPCTQPNINSEDGSTAVESWWKWRHQCCHHNSHHKPHQTNRKDI